MAQFSVNAQRFDPYKNFKFRVKWDGRYVAGVSKVGALKRTTEVVEHREGGDPSSGRKSPGRTKYEAITLERGVTHDTEFEKWANKVWNFGSGLGAEVSLKDFRKDVIIEVYNEAGQLVLAYKVYRCWCRSSKPCLTWTPTPTRWQSRPSSWRTRAGNATTRWPSRPSRRSLNRHKRRARPQHNRAAGCLGARVCAAAAPPRTRAPEFSLPGVRAGTRFARLTVGQRDSLLLTLHEWTFGPNVTGVVRCPQCAEEVELAFDVADVRVGGAAPLDGSPSTRTVAVDGYEVVFRAPDSTDLLALAANGAATREALLARCLVSVTALDPPDLAPEAEAQTAAPLREALQAAIAEAVDAALEVVDPQAEIELSLVCPACGHQWQALFDIEAFFWNELTTWAHHLLRQVHVLASAYGWREADISGPACVAAAVLPGNGRWMMHYLERACLRVQPAHRRRGVW